MTPAGSGQLHQVVVSMAGQLSSPSFSTLSYEPPILLSVSGQGAFGASTRGGQPIYVHGDNFGPGRASLDIQLRYASFLGGNCNHVSQVLVVCQSAEGFGTGFAYHVKIDGQDSNMGVFNGSYAPPSVFEVKSLASGEFLDNALGVGGEQVLISGINFGPVTANNVIAATYYNEVSEFVAKGCQVRTPHEEIVCTTAAGAGESHSWSVEVGSQKSRAPETSYQLPQIDAIIYQEDDDGITNGTAARSIFAAVVPQTMSTRGMQAVVVIGANFGPPRSPCTAVP